MIYQLGVSQKELHTMLMKRRLFLLLAGVIVGFALYGFVMFWVRTTG